MKYYFLAWAGASSCNLDMLDKLEKWVCGTVRLTLTSFPKELAHRRNVATQSPSIGIPLVDGHLNWLNWDIHLLFY